MTVSDLLDALRSLPGHTEIRPVIAIKFVKRQGQSDEEEYRLAMVELGTTTVRLILERDR